MKVCLISEGCFPRIPDSTSDFLKVLCKNSRNTEYELLILCSEDPSEDSKGWEISPCIKKVKTIRLKSLDLSLNAKKIRFSPEDERILKGLIEGGISGTELQNVLDFVHRHQDSLQSIVMSRFFYEACLQQYQKEDSCAVFKDYLQNLRNMYYSLLEILVQPIEQADVYHSLSCSYAGLLGCTASCITGKPLVLTEISALTQEKEERVARASWIPTHFKDLWVRFFRELAAIAYQQAEVVTCCCRGSREQQQELGCSKEKIRIIPLSAGMPAFEHKKLPSALEPDCYHVGCISPVIPDQDLKTLLLAFRLMKQSIPQARLTILGAYDRDPRYYQECLTLLRELQIQGIQFAGQVQEENYLSQFQLMVYSGIREIQPTAVLRAMAAGKPVVSTNAGDCRQLLQGDEPENPGHAGILVPLMDSEAMAQAMISIAKDSLAARRMGEAGRKRVQLFYGEDRFLNAYETVYQNAAEGRRCHGGT